MKDQKKTLVTLSEVVSRYAWGILYENYNGIENEIMKNNNNSYFPEEYHDVITGGFKFSLREMQNILTLTELNSLINKKIVLIIDQDVYLRGESYFVNLINKSEKISDVFLLLNRAAMISSLLRKYQIVNSTSEKILILSLLDSLKNIFLILFNFERNYIKNKDKGLVRKYDFIIGQISDYFWGVYLMENITQVATTLLDYVRIILTNVNTIYRDRIDTDRIVGATLRGYRENNKIIDYQKLGEKFAMIRIPRMSLFVGIEYGGIELPYIVNSIRYVNKKSSVLHEVLNVSGYSNFNLRNKIHNIKPSIKFKNCYIFDDSITTGRTISKIIEHIKNQFENIFTIFISFKLSNRKHHIFMKRHGGVNPQFVKDSLIISLSNYEDTFTVKSYLGVNGVFDKNKENIKKLYTKEL